MNKTEIEEIKNIFDSIICLAVEGPDATSMIAVINKIIKEAGRGYNLAERHLTPAAPDSECRCDAQHCEAVVGGMVCDDCDVL